MTKAALRDVIGRGFLRGGFEELVRESERMAHAYRFGSLGRQHSEQERELLALQCEWFGDEAHRILGWELERYERWGQR